MLVTFPDIPLRDMFVDALFQKTSIECRRSSRGPNAVIEDNNLTTSVVAVISEIVPVYSGVVYE